MTDQKTYNVLFLCTGNSARSILAEAIANHLGDGRLQAWSAGSQPRGVPNPAALELIADKGLDASGLRSKSWDEFAGADAPRMDLVITVCDNAAGESCPLWPGAPLKAHWGIADPAGTGETPDEVRAAFAQAWDLLEARFRALVALPFETLSRAEFQAALNRIGAMEGATEWARSGGAEAGA